jgi:uncharacterized protein (DUF2141 family)
MPAADRLSRSRLLPSGRRRWMQAADPQRSSINSVLSYFLLTQLLFIATGHAAELSVSVSGVSNDRGHVVIDVCTRAEFLGPRCAYHGSTPAKPGTVIVNVASVSPGSYAIQAYHDENDNLMVDRNFLGIPNEAIGFSNNTPVRFGPPRFDDAEVIVLPEGIRTALQLHSIWP